MTIYFKVLCSQCHYSMYYCCCISEIHACHEMMSTNNIPRQARPVQQNISITWSRTAQKNLRIFQLLNYLSSASCDQLWCIGIFVWNISPCSRPTTLLYRGQEGIFIGLIEGYYCTSIQVLILPQLLVVSSNNCSTFKCFSVSASRLLQVPVSYTHLTLPTKA